MDHQRRVLVLNERDPRHPAAGGAEVHVAEVSRRLCAQGFEITQAACSFRGAPEREEQDGLRVWRLGALGVYYPRVAWTVARETRRGRYDVVVEHLNKEPFCAALYSAAPVLAVDHQNLMTSMAEAFDKKNAHVQKIRKARIKELLRFPGRVLEHDKEDEKKI